MNQGILLLEFFFLWLLSRRLSETIFTFFLVLFRSPQFALTAITLLLFPGTIIHELSHLFTAEILGVRTGKLNLTPEGIDGRQKEIRAGSVAIAKTDPVRRTAIGVAPVVMGVVALSAIAYMIHRSDMSDRSDMSYVIKIIQYYLLFAVSNSMFSSKEDMKGVVPVFVTLGLFAGAAYIAGLRIGLTGQALETSIRLIDSLTRSLGLVLAVNGVILLVVKILLALTEKIRNSAGR